MADSHVLHRYIRFTHFRTLCLAASRAEVEHYSREECLPQGKARRPHQVLNDAAANGRTKPCGLEDKDEKDEGETFRRCDEMVTGFVHEGRVCTSRKCFPRLFLRH